MTLTYISKFLYRDVLKGQVIIIIIKICKIHHTKTTLKQKEKIITKTLENFKISFFLFIFCNEIKIIITAKQYLMYMCRFIRITFLFFYIHINLMDLIIFIAYLERSFNYQVRCKL